MDARIIGHCVRRVVAKRQKLLWHTFIKQLIKLHEVDDSEIKNRNHLLSVIHQVIVANFKSYTQYCIDRLGPFYAP